MLARPLRACAAVAALVVIACCAWPAAAQVDDRYVVVKAAKAIPVVGDDINDAIIVIKNGKIDAVGKNVDYPSDSRVIDASKLIVMPGMISPRTRLGLRDYRRSGNRSHLKLAEHFYPPEDDAYERLLEAGYTAIGLYPDGAGLPGQYLVIGTHDPAPKSGVKTEGLVRVTFDQPGRDKRVLRDALKAAKEETDKAKQAATQPTTTTAPTRPTTRPAGGPTTGPSTRPTTTATRPATQPAGKPELAPLRSLLEKTDGFRALVEFSAASDVVHFADAVKRYEFARAYAFTGGGDDAYLVADHELLGKAKAVVALPSSLPTMPLTVNPYNRVKRFIDAGCTVAIMPMADNVPAHERIREQLAELVRAGLSRTDALRGVTLVPAQMLLLDKQLGSIEKDKSADLIFLDRDPLDPFAQVRRVMIAGKIVFDQEKDKR